MWWFIQVHFVSFLLTISAVCLNKPGKNRGNCLWVCLHTLFASFLNAWYRPLWKDSAIAVHFDARFAPDCSSKSLEPPKRMLPSYKARNAFVWEAATYTKDISVFVPFPRGFVQWVYLLSLFRCNRWSEGNNSGNMEKRKWKRWYNVILQMSQLWAAWTCNYSIRLLATNGNACPVGSTLAQTLRCFEVSVH